MSIFALAMLGLIFGWLTCVVCLITDGFRLSKPPVLISNPKRRQAHVNITLLQRTRRPTRRRRALKREGSVPSKRRLSLVQHYFGIVVFCAASALVIIEILQDFHSTYAASIEDIITEPRVAALALASAIGFAVRLYRRPILSGIDTLSKIALVGGGHGKTKNADSSDNTGEEGVGIQSINYIDAKFPWYVEVGLLLSLVVVAILWFNPQLLKNLSSFKAGGVEAHFATATGNATVQSGLIVGVDPARKTIARGWANFTYPTRGDDRYATYDGQTLDITAGPFFETYLKRIFAYRAELYEKKKPMLFETNRHLARLTSDLASLVQSHGEGAAYMPKTLTTSWVEACSEISPENLKFCDAHKDFDLSILSKKTWDPYVIQAIADLLLILEKRKEQEDFLISVTSDSEKGEDICPDGCKTAGQLSLMYAVVLAKVRSERPWPFREMLTELSKALRGIDAVLEGNAATWANDLKIPTKNMPPYEETDKLFRRNRFIDLTLGLELFYQRALQGQRFTPQQTQIWRDWLTETRAVIELLEGHMVTWPPPFSEETRRSWLQAKTMIYDKVEITEDAYIGIALSLVLIGSSDGNASDRDCTAARSFLVRAEEALPNYFTTAKLDEDDKGTYRGFVEQVKIAAENRCPP